MKKLLLICLVIFIAISLAGCAGGGGGIFGQGAQNTSARETTGNMSLTVNWPATGKSVLSSAYSLKINVATQFTPSSGSAYYDRQVSPQILKHTSTNTSETITMSGIPVGATTVIVQAYDTTGVEIGYGTRNVTISTGTNDSVTVSLASGTFGYSFVGFSDIAVPTTSSGGTTTKYLFVNNYNSASISVINQSTDTVAGTIALPAGTKPTKGVFDSTGSNYYVVSANSSDPKIYKIPITNTTSWSANTATALNVTLSQWYTPQDIAYEMTSAGNEYLWVSMWGSGTTWIYRIKLSDLTLISGADVTDMSANPRYVGLYKSSNLSDGKIIALYANTSLGTTLSAVVCYVTGGSKSSSINMGAAYAIGDVSSPIAGTHYYTYPVMTSTTSLYVPYSTGVKLLTYSDSANTLTFSTLWDSATTGLSSGLKLLYGQNKFYAINNSALKYGSNFGASLTSAGSFSPYGLADMAFSSDSSKIYMTDYGNSAVAGNKVYVQSLSSLSTTTSITVGTNPFGVAVKP